MIPFKYISLGQIEVLKKEGLTENDLYNHYSDLYIGCNSHEQAQRIINEIKTATTFIPQKDSDMGKYPIAIEIPLGAANFHYENCYLKKHKN